MESFTKSPLYKVFSRELGRIVKSKALLFTSLIGPIISLILVALIFSSGVVRDLPVAVVDMDNSQFSHKVIRQIDATSIASVEACSDLQEAYSQMRKGHYSAIVVMPVDFERDMVRMVSPEIALYVNNANVIKGGMLYSGIYKTLATINAGVKVNLSMKSGLTYKQAIQNAQPIRVDLHLLFNPYGNYSYFLTLSLLPLMIVIFTFFVTVYALGMELKTGTAKEFLDTAKNSVLVALTGKSMPYTIILFFDMMIMNLLLFRALGTPFEGSILVLLFSEFLLIVVYQLIGIALLALTANTRLTLSLGSAYTMMALTFAGITFPALSMPLIAKVFSWIFPYTFWIKIFTGQTIKAQPLYTTVPDFLVLFLFIVLSLFSFRVLKRKLADSKYWGRS